jgi:hypothetical protein
MLTLEETTTEVVTPISDANATPLTTAEANALLSMSATAERKPTVRAGTRVERHWRTSGQVD